ncbi:hypothetical protein J1N35_011506 [Gossypium stocksii]|uniref:DUF4283 domain-containing protein n=1 Tax=Gossypium stocksii TaxID=47602 RepID=A0A9D3W3M4_9ROSI|nr:hypothetical protein J1N35_011506 [Gossypium stocksii]
MELKEREEIPDEQIDSQHLRGEVAINQEGEADVDMEPSLPADKPRSWKDHLMGIGLRSNDKTETPTKEFEEDDLDLLEGDIKKTIVNGIPAIKFSKRITQLLIKDMEHTVVIKLLGRNIGYATLQNKIHSLWQLSQPFRLMDIKNRYYLAKFRNLGDCEKVLSQGP